MQEITIWDQGKGFKFLTLILMMSFKPGLIQVRPKSKEGISTSKPKMKAVNTKVEETKRSMKVPFYDYLFYQDCKVKMAKVCHHKQNLSRPGCFDKRGKYIVQFSLHSVLLLFYNNSKATVVFNVKIQTNDATK